MKRAQAYLAYGIRKIWTLFALFLVVSAVAISLLRISLPYLDQNKHLVEDYIANNYAADLRIGTISANWSHIGPSLVLNDVTLRDPGQNVIELSIARVFVEVDFWRSLRSWTLQSEQFELNGANLVVNTHLASGDSEDANVANMVSQLFLERLQRFSVSDSELTINTEHNSQTYVLREVSWRNHNLRHQAVGRLRIDELANNAVAFVLDLTGPADNLEGTLFAQANALDFSPWFNEFTTEEQTLLESRGNFTLWANFADSAITQVQANIRPSIFKWQSLDSSVVTEITRGRVLLEPAVNGWTYNIEDLVLSANQQSMNTSFAGSLDSQGNVLLESLNAIDLAPLVALAPLFVNRENVAAIESIAPQGVLSSLQLRYFQERLQIASQLTQVSWQSTGSLPGLNNLQANFFWDDDKGQISLSTDNAVLATRGLLDNDLALQHFSSSIYIYPEQRLDEPSVLDWMVFSDDIQFISDKVSFRQQLRFNLHSAQLALAMQIEALPVTVLPDLFPQDHMGKGTKDYLTRALGTQLNESDSIVNSANLVWHGSANEFPFAQQQGVFQAQVDIQSASFEFSPNWPAIEDLSISLLFENNSLTMRSAATKLHAVNLTDLVATIPSLSGGEFLHISATGESTGKEVAELMMSSQLASSLGRLLTEDIIIDGELKTELALTIPLRGGDVMASGAVQLNHSDIYIDALDLSFEKASGELSFINSQVYVDQLTTQLFQQEVSVSMAGNNQENGYGAIIDLYGAWDITKLVSDHYPILTPYLSGQSDVRTSVELLLGEDVFDYSAIFTASLKQTSSTLPSPFNTEANAEYPLNITATGNQQASIIEARLVDQVMFSGILPHAERRFSRAHLAIGENSFNSLGVGFSISASMPQIEAQPWIQVVSAIAQGSDTERQQVLGPPERVYITAKSLDLAGTPIDNANIIAKYRQGNWEFDLSAKQMKANLFIHADLQQRGIDINADFIRIASLASMPESSSQWQANNLPPIRFRCEQCIIDKFDFGKVLIDGQPNELGYAFERVAFNNGLAELNADGFWRFDQSSHATSLSGQLTSSDFGQWLKQLGVDSGIKDSKANFEFLLTWPEKPWQFDTAKLNGEIDWSLSDGYITEISDKGSRIFTLFSFNSLIRKLSLDFRDVFAQGFFYDDIAGSLQVSNGKAETNDTVVDGGAGEITINGVTDLVTNKIDYQFSFTPNVTGNLPVLMYFMVNPPTALAALALDRVLTSTKVISNINYTVTGTLDEPIFNEVGRDSKEVELPAKVQPEDSQNPEQQERVDSD